MSETLYCNFCAKSQHEVHKLIAGPATFICNECVELCNDIIRDDKRRVMVASDIGVVVKTTITEQPV